MKRRRLSCISYKNVGFIFSRYFTCEHKFGLFAPAHKVSRSPAKNRRPSCQVHHTATSLRRAGSKESLTSSIASVASSIRTNATAASARVIHLLGVHSYLETSRHFIPYQKSHCKIETQLTNWLYFLVIILEFFIIILFVSNSNRRRWFVLSPHPHPLQSRLLR